MADVYRDKLISIVLTGANDDGAEGSIEVKNKGGFTIAQDPGDSEFPVMPQSAIDTGKIDLVLEVKDLVKLFNYKNYI